MKFVDIEVDDEWLEERAHEDYLNPRDDEAHDLSDVLVRVVCNQDFGKTKAPPSGRVARDGAGPRGIVAAPAANPRRGSMAGSSERRQTPTAPSPLHRWRRPSVNAGNPPSPSRGAQALPLPGYGGPKGQWQRRTEGRRTALAGAQLEHETQQLIARLRRGDGSTRSIWGSVPSTCPTPASEEQTQNVQRRPSEQASPKR